MFAQKGISWRVTFHARNPSLNKQTIMQKNGGFIKNLVSNKCKTGEENLTQYPTIKIEGCNVLHTNTQSI